MSMLSVTREALDAMLQTPPPNVPIEYEQMIVDKKHELAGLLCIWKTVGEIWPTDIGHLFLHILTTGGDKEIVNAYEEWLRSGKAKETKTPTVEPMDWEEL